MSEAAYASVLLLTRNGMPILRRVLDALASQATAWPYEVLAIDSGSTDGTLEALRGAGVRTVSIAPADFGHGTTRNEAARLATGEFLVFLVQDAIPFDQHWLAALVGACEDERVAGAYSRQVPRPESALLTCYMTQGTTPVSLERMEKTLPLGVKLEDLSSSEQFQLVLFQNASSCVRRDAWRRHHFAELPYGEDIEWGRRVVEAGGTLVYEPASAVFHSHDRSVLYVLKRTYADHRQVYRLFGLRSLPSALATLRFAVWSTFDAWRWLWSRPAPAGQRIWAVVSAPVYACAWALGTWLGPRLEQAGGRRWADRLDAALRVGV